MEKEDFRLSNIFEAMFTLCVYVGPVLRFIRKLKLDNHSIYRFFQNPLPIKLRTIASSSIMQLIMDIGLMMFVIELMLSISPESQMETVLIPEDILIPWFFVFKLVSLVLIAPICEEIIFRGYLLGRLTYKLGLKKGIIFSSMIFGILHGQNMFGAIMMGII